MTREVNLDAYLTLAQAAKVTGRTKAAVAHWRDRGWTAICSGERRRLTVRRKRNGRVLYRLGDLLAAERDTHLNPKSRRQGGGSVPADPDASRVVV